MTILHGSPPDTAMPEPIDSHLSLGARLYEEYRERRYLKDVSDEEILQRARDLIQNLATLTPAGKLGVTSPKGGRSNLMMWRLFTHILEESQIRTGDPRGLFMKYGMKDWTGPKATFPYSPVSPAVLHAIPESAGNAWLYKFGKRIHIRDLHQRGHLLLRPAMFYDDVSLGPAIADDELSYELASDIFQDDLIHLDPFQRRLSDVFGGVDLKRHRLTSPTSYYIYCMTYVLDIRLFEDFRSDTVLIIKDPALFALRFLNAFGKHLSEWFFDVCMVNYFDPYHPNQHVKTVFRSKHFRYQYQKEIRFAFLPPKPERTLESIELDLGSLTDIATVIERD